MISDKNKKIIGKLFKRYKENQNISITEIEQANISSINTYYNACKGEIIKNDEFYINYCKFFNHPLEINNIIDNWINEFDGKLYHVIDFLDNKAIKDLYDEFNIKLNDYKDYAIYHEYHYMIDLLCNYYISNRYLSLEEIYDVLDLGDIKLKEQIPDKIKQSINYNVGMQDYLVGRYERAYELFDENLIKYNSLFTLLFQCSICSRLDKEYPKELFSNEIEDRYDFIYLNYFRMKHNQETNEKLAKYIY